MGTPCAFRVTLTGADKPGTETDPSSSGKADLAMVMNHASNAIRMTEAPSAHNPSRRQPLERGRTEEAVLENE
jgi:hypothetical protein